MTNRFAPCVLSTALFIGAIGGATFGADNEPAMTRVSHTQAASHPSTRATTHRATQPASAKSITTKPATKPAVVTKKVVPIAVDLPATTLPSVEIVPAKKEGTELLSKIPSQMRVNLAWQIALESADFSPGILDGHFGRKSKMALAEYAARHFPGKDVYDPDVYLALNVSVDEAVVAYTITVDDASKIGPLPEDWNEKAKLDRLTYDTMIDYITEKFHCTRALLQTMNPGMKFSSLDVGTTLFVPNIRPFPSEVSTQINVSPRVEKADRIEVNLAEKTIRTFDKVGAQTGLYHCSVAKDKAKLPDRDAVVKTFAINPEYKFDPKYWPEVNNVDRILIIKPGPRNPVGSVWIGLDLPGYGIHGNPKPELIGKTGSHGCFRLTNWDALKLVNFVRIGMTVKMINPEKEGAKEEKD